MTGPNMSRRFLFFVIISLIFRIVFSLTVGLIDDEAYHWSWTQTLQLSYFDHPAMIAWLEALSTSFFGNTLVGVRLPSFLLYLGVLYFSWRLSWDLFGEIAAQVVVALLLWTPLWGFGGYVASPETPFMFFWQHLSWSSASLFFTLSRRSLLFMAIILGPLWRNCRPGRSGAFTLDSSLGLWWLCRFTRNAFHVFLDSFLLDILAIRSRGFSSVERKKNLALSGTHDGTWT